MLRINTTDEFQDEVAVWFGTCRQKPMDLFVQSWSISWQWHELPGIEEVSGELAPRPVPMMSLADIVPSLAHSFEKVPTYHV